MRSFFLTTSGYINTRKRQFLFISLYPLSLVKAGRQEQTSGFCCSFSLTKRICFVFPAARGFAACGRRGRAGSPGWRKPIFFPERKRVWPKRKRIPYSPALFYRPPSVLTTIKAPLPAAAALCGFDGFQPPHGRLCRNIRAAAAQWGCWQFYKIQWSGSGGWMR